jgi:hypothetical protein
MNENQYIPGMLGCSDGGCLFAYKEPGTMVTNGGCSCMRELQRTEEGFKAVRLITHLRRELAGLNDWMKQPAPYVPKRDMNTKVMMIKDIRDQAKCGLKEAKEAMDAVYDSCSTFEQVVELGVLHALRPKYDYSCDRLLGCVCGGDTQGVRQGCGWYTGQQL